MDDGVRVTEITETPVRYSTNGKPHTMRVVHTLAWCTCGWESPPTTSETRAKRHLLVHRWLDHDGPQPSTIPAIYREQAERR